MKVSIEIDEAAVRALIFKHVQEMLVGAELVPEDVKIEVKSKQNYQSEWEPAAFRAVVGKIL